MLEVLVDESCIIKDGLIFLTSYQDYANHWNNIIEFIFNETKETIILQNTSLKTCFLHLKDNFRHKIEIESISPRSEWIKLLGFELPNEIEEFQIAKLLSSDHVNKLKEKNNKKLGTLCILLETEEFRDSYMEEFLMECILKDAEHKYPQFLTNIIDETIIMLPHGKREFWQHLKKTRNRKETLLDAIETYIVKNYPSESILKEKYYKDYLAYSRFNFPSDFSHYINEAFKRDVMSYLNKLESNCKIFSFISGKLKEEWDTVNYVLKKNPIQDRSTIDSLLRKASENADAFKKIKKYMPVSTPPHNISEENIGEWIEQYFAFYLYSHQIRKPENTENFVKSFENFILKHYFNCTEFFIQHSILIIRKKVKDYLKKKRKVLILIVDGLNYAYYKEIENIFGEKGDFIFSTLPTITGINKKRILSGLLDLNKSYSTILEELFGEYRWKEASSSETDLRDFLEEHHCDLYIYWENQFDKLIHNYMAFEKRFKDHTEILNKISKKIENFLEGGIALITGDHGYTILPKNENKKITLPKDVAESLTHQRVLKLKNGEKETLDNVYWIEDKLAVAKGYHYFNSLPQGATHGGATPEELVLPFFIIEKKDRPLESLVFNLLEEKYLRKKRHDTYLSIYNPNVYIVKVISMKFVPSILKVFSQIPILIEPGENKFEAELDLSAIITEDCKVFVEYKVDKVEKVYQSSFNITTTGAIRKEFFDEWE